MCEIIGVSYLMTDSGIQKDFQDVKTQVVNKSKYTKQLSLKFISYTCFYYSFFSLFVTSLDHWILTKLSSSIFLTSPTGKF